MRHVFHLALPVRDLAETRRFYAELLGAHVGRASASWCDILLWGHQLTFHEKPDQLLADGEQGVRHFGVVLPWAEWEEFVAHVERSGVEPLAGPRVSKVGTADEQAKLLLRDPSGHVLEIKAYRQPGHVLPMPG